MELRQVRYFVGIAQAASFGRASDELHVARSALSRQIKLLEAELGAKLFVRAPGHTGVELTQAGTAFMPEALNMVKAADAGRAAVRRLAGAEGGHVTVVTQGSWDAWAPWVGLVGAFRERHPGVALVLKRVRSVAEIIRAVDLGEADLGVAMTTSASIPDWGRLKVEHLLTEGVMIALPPGHPRAGDGALDLAELADEEWLLAGVDVELMTELTRPLGYVPRVELEVPDKTAVRQLLQAGQGIAPFGASEQPFFEGDDVHELSDPDLTYSIVTIMRRGPTNAGARSARTFLRGAFGLAE